ncbi:MAG: hypothetical protein NTZ78_11585 [Candidatus Aureabacteria bacterium]|nr:hypothetical protein [Candidatus Auribacterota bacterium]
MIDKILGVAAPEKKGKTKARKKSSKKVEPVTKKRAKRIRKKASKVAVKIEKKIVKRRGRRASKKALKKISRASTPSILIVGPDGKIEPVWIKYSQMTPAKPSRKPSIPTNIRVGNLVQWTTDGGKERMGIVQEFYGDSAVVGMGGKNELIRIGRLKIIAAKVKTI